MVSDAAARVQIDLEPLLEKVVERVRESDHWNPVMAADEIADEVFADTSYDEALAEAYARALADVHEQYLAHALRVTEAIEVLLEEGREAWIARAISHDFAERLAWDALDRLDLLTELPGPGLCATCGGEIGPQPGEQKAADAV